MEICEICEICKDLPLNTDFYFYPPVPPQLKSRSRILRCRLIYWLDRSRDFKVRYDINFQCATLDCEIIYGRVDNDLPKKEGTNHASEYIFEWYSEEYDWTFPRRFV